EKQGGEPAGALADHAGESDLHVGLAERLHAARAFINNSRGATIAERVEALNVLSVQDAGRVL
ncbi:hypothetical protein ACC692_38695, partial [Rhizobium ruizarguesonis]